MVLSRFRTVTAVLAAVMVLGLAQDKPQKMAKDPAEAELINSIAKDPDAANRLKSLEKWSKDYAETAYAPERQQFYLVTYQQLNRTKDAFAVAQEILKANPNDELALRTIISAMYVLNPPNAAELDAAEKASTYLLANLDAIYAADKKPATQSAADWEKLKPQMQVYAQKTLGVIAFTRKDNAKAEAEFIKTLKLDPTQGQASYFLANALLAQRTTDPAKQPPSIFEFARAAVWDGPNSLPADFRKTVMTSVAKTYKQYHGSDEGFDQLVALAKTNALPPEGFTILSNSDIAAAKAKAQQAADAADPMRALWRTIKTELTGDNGPSYFESSVKDAALPGGVNNVRKFKGRLVSMSPALRPKELTLAVEKPDVADVTLKLDSPLAGKMEPGGEIEFEGVAKSFTKEPYMLTFEVEKAKLSGWTGKNTPAAPKKSAAARRRAR